MNKDYRFPVRKQKDLLDLDRRPFQQIRIPYKQKDLQYFLRHAPTLPAGWCDVRFETGLSAIPESEGMLWPRGDDKIGIVDANLGTEISQSLAGGRVASLRAYLPFWPFSDYDRFKETELRRFPDQFKMLQSCTDELVKNGYRVSKLTINAMLYRVNYDRNKKTGTPAGSTHLPRIHVSLSEMGNFMTATIEDTVFDTPEAKAMRKVFDDLGAVRKEHYSGYRSGNRRLTDAEKLERIKKELSK